MVAGAYSGRAAVCAEKAWRVASAEREGTATASVQRENTHVMVRMALFPEMDAVMGMWSRMAQLKGKAGGTTRCSKPWRGWRPGTRTRSRGASMIWQIGAGFDEVAGIVVLIVPDEGAKEAFEAVAACVDGGGVGLMEEVGGDVGGGDGDDVGGVLAPEAVAMEVSACLGHEGQFVRRYVVRRVWMRRQVRVVRESVCGAYHHALRTTKDLRSQAEGSNPHTTNTTTTTRPPGLTFCYAGRLTCG